MLIVCRFLYGEQGRYFEPEMIPKLRHSRRGLVSFVNNGSNMLGSQFFITLGLDVFLYLCVYRSSNKHLTQRSNLFIFIFQLVVKVDQILFSSFFSFFICFV